MHCPYCNEEHPDTAAFCPRTGQKIPAARTCGNCGAALEDSLKVCPACGSRVEQQENIEYREEKAAGPSGKLSKSPRILLLSLASVLLIILIVYLLSSKLQTTNDETFSASSPKATQAVSQDEQTASTLSTNTPMNGSTGKNQWKVAVLHDDGTLLLSDNSGEPALEIQTGISKGDTGRMSWSPNGRYLLIQYGFPVRERYVVDTDEKKTYHWPQPSRDTYGFIWAPDSESLVITSYTDSAYYEHLDLVSISGEPLAQVEGLTFSGMLSWSPDGNKLAVPGSAVGGEPRRLFLLSAETGEFQDITPAGFDWIVGTGWLQDGRMIFAAWVQNQLTWHVLDLSTGSTSRLFTLPAINGSVGHPVISPSGRMIAEPAGKDDGTWTVYIENLVDHKREEVWQSDLKGSVKELEWSPDERYLVFQYETGQNPSQSQMYIVDLQTRDIHSLEGALPWRQSHSNDVSFTTNWISASQFLAERSTDGKNYEIVLADVLGNEQKKVCSFEQGNRLCAPWLPPLSSENVQSAQLDEHLPATKTSDSSAVLSVQEDWIAFLNENNIWLMHPDGTDPTQITNNHDDTKRIKRFKWSPDGKTLAYSMSSASGTAIFLYDLQSSTTTGLLIGVGGGFDWSLTGEQLIYDTSPKASDPFANKGLWVVRIDNGKTHQVVRPSPSHPGFLNPQWSTDSSSIIFDIPALEPVGSGIVNYANESIIALQLNARGGAGLGNCEWKPSQLIVACVTETDDEPYKPELRLFDAKGDITQRLVLPERMETPFIKWSPSGEKIAVGYFSNGKAQTDILLLDTEEIQTLTSGYPSGWSPDEKWLLVTDSGLNSMPKIHIVNAQTGDWLYTTEGSSAIWQP